MYMYFKQLFAPLVGRNPAGVWSAAKLQSLLLTLTLMVAALGVSSVVAAEKKMVKDPTTGKMVSVPEYGGTITYAQKCVPSSTAIYLGPTCDPLSGVAEKLGIGNWATDRNLFRFQNQLFPLFAIKGQLAESWETPDILSRTCSRFARAFTGTIRHPCQVGS